MEGAGLVSWLGPAIFSLFAVGFVVSMYVLGRKLIEDEKRSQK